MPCSCQRRILFHSGRHFWRRGKRRCPHHCQSLSQFLPAMVALVYCIQDSMEMDEGSTLRIYIHRYIMEGARIRRAKQGDGEGEPLSIAPEQEDFHSLGLDSHLVGYWRAPPWNIQRRLPRRGRICRRWFWQRSCSVSGRLGILVVRPSWK